MWNFKLDPNDAGFRESWWSDKLKPPTFFMPVPSSFNDVTADNTLRLHIGWVWYQREIFVPSGWKGSRIMLRFEAAFYYSAVWLDDNKLIEHNGGNLPFEVEITLLVFESPGPHRLTVALNNTLTPTTIPPAQMIISGNNDPYHPPGYRLQKTYFDFFSYSGLNRAVKIYSTPHIYVDDITVNYRLTSDGAAVDYSIVILPQPPKEVFVALLDADHNVVSTSTAINGSIIVPKASLRLWEPGNPYLYTLEVKAGADVYRLNSIGIRTIRVTQTQFLINEKPIYFRGVGLMEDSDARGRGYDDVVLSKDFYLMQWLNANAFRTSHYPYADEFYQMADRLGYLVIGEPGAIGMNIAEFFSNQTLEFHKGIMKDMINRDKNHPSVVMWSLANEPCCECQEAAYYFKSLSDYTRSLDPNRPITVVQGIMIHIFDQQCSQFFKNMPVPIFPSQAVLLFLMCCHLIATTLGIAIMEL
eukprot:TRINITY_DN3483_c0_g1_i2.p1 TRINITY_DN3483_c0_g1~~TRINITY_DN3483_c0_g1_i2.p1  ORF type:complete len:519 (-),score=70.81 TRINITY_DN3483_c0_g1_i2:444-1856(-)